jgi:hypothetical protein
LILCASNPCLAASGQSNPLVNQIEVFIRHALKLVCAADGMVAMLVRNEFDCAGGRKGLFNKPPFAMKVVLTRRPSWSDMNVASPRHNFSWFIWDWKHAGPGVLRYAA